jgi:hypothetical protein
MRDEEQISRRARIKAGPRLSVRICSRIGWVVCVAFVGFVACKKTGPSGPALAVTNSLEAQQELRALEERWEVESDTTRRELREDLEAFIRRHGTDPSVARARVLLAQIALLERRLGDAEEIIAPVSLGPKGSARDEAMVILAAIDNRRGNHEEALRRLEPLSGKLLTREGKDRYSRERTIAAMASRRWRLSIAVMVTWLSESEPETAHVKRWIESAIDGVPSHALTRLLEDFEHETPEDSKTTARDWLHRVLIERLSEDALSREDPLLARDLLTRALPWLRASKEGAELALLAAKVQKDAQVTGRAVGVVLGGDSEFKRRSSIRFASGMLRGLGLGLGLASDSHRVRTLTAEDRGSVASALSELSGLGASILIAGVDEEGAEAALAFAESRGVPVIALSQPKTHRELNFGFVFGVGEARQEKILADLLPEAATWAFVGANGSPCRSAAVATETEGPSFRLWKEQGVQAVGILGNASCTRDVIHELSAISWSPAVIVGLEGAHEEFVHEGPGRSLQVGGFPLPDSGNRGYQASQLEDEVAQGRRPPPLTQESDWFFTLGFDLARLVEAALVMMPDTQVTQKEEVRIRHEQVRAALLKVRVPLVSTEASGFSMDHFVERAFSLSGPPNSAATTEVAR